MAHVTLPCAGCNAKTLTGPLQKTAQGSMTRPPSPAGCASSGLPLPRLHRALVMPRRASREGHIEPGCQGGPCFILSTGAWSPTEAPQGGTASPQLPRIPTPGLCRGTPLRGAEWGQKGAQDPPALQSLSAGGPRGDLPGGGGKAQAGGPEAGGRPEAWVPPARNSVGQSPSVELP